MKLVAQGMSRSAEFSACRTYRYTLERRWADGPMMLWVLLNPSTADAIHDDPTNRRGISFSKREGFGACVFVNLFAYRSPDPSVMKQQRDPIGPDNDEWIAKMASKADRIVLGWGAQGGHMGRDRDVLREVIGEYPLYCLGLTKTDLQPKHPLYLSNSTQFERYGHYPLPKFRP